MIVLKVTAVFNPTKKGKQYLTVEVVEGEVPKAGEVLNVDYIPEKKELEDERS